MRHVAGAIATTILVVSLAGPVAAGWPPLGGPGVIVCDPTGDPRMPSSTPDGSGGAYYVWFDSRDIANQRFFAQHVSGSGAPLWDANGVSIGANLAAWEHSAVVEDGQGGAIVVWRDFRADTAGNLYAQRLDPEGALLWGPEGVAVNLGARHEVSIVAASDGSGGAFVAWRDDRDSIFTIRVQRMDGDGDLLWDADGLVTAPSHIAQSDPRIAADGVGGVLVAWTEFRGALHGFAQRLSDTGIAQWPALGVQLSTSTLGTFVNDIAADGTGGMLVAWLDYRSQNTWAQAFAQRVTAEGNTAWAPDGENLSGATWFVETTFVCSDGAGGAIVGWYHYKNNGWNGALAQRLSPSGAKMWTLPVEVGLGYGGLGWNNVRMIPDGAGGAVFGWNGGDENVSYSMYAQRVNPEGELMWTPGGVVLSTLTGIAHQLVLVPDGTGGAIEGWIDPEGYSDPGNLGAQRVAGEGTLGVPKVEVSGAALVCVPTPARAREGVEVRFASSPGSSVDLKVYDAGGRLVRSLDASSRVNAARSVRWDGRDAQGRVGAPGLYLVRLRAGSVSARAKVVIVE